MSAIKRKPWPLDAKTISNLTVVLVGITFFFLLYRFDDVRRKITMVTNVLSPFIMGFAIAYLLNSPMRFFERKVYRDMKARHMLSIVTVYLLAVAVLAVLLNLILPQVVDSIVQIGNNLQAYLNNLNALVQELAQQFHIEGEGLENLVLTYNDIMKRVTAMMGNALPQLLNIGVAVGSGVVSGIITVVTALISSVYMLSGKGKLIAQIKKVLYAFGAKDKVDGFLRGCHRANSIFVGFINGKIIDSAIIGVLCFVLSLIFRIPYPVLVSVVVGFTNVIPFFGPIIGAIPCLMILIIVDPLAALRFAILVVALQQFDGNILGPKILGDSTGLSAIWVLVAIVVGGGLFGPIGMLLGVPAFAVIYMITRDVVSARLKQRGIDGEGRPIQAQVAEESESE